MDEHQIVYDELDRNLVISYISEFFNPSTSNQRKASIEKALHKFSQDPNSWKEALYILSAESRARNQEHNEFILMYFLSVLETSIKIHWNCSGSWSTEEQNQIKTVLGAYLFGTFGAGAEGNANAAPRPNFIRNKVIKLLADIGKFSWPDQGDPEFMKNVLHLTLSDQTVVLGLLFLKTISEEWTIITEETSSTRRKAQLKKYLLKEVPGIFKILQNIISTGYKFRTNTENHPPPPHFNDTISLGFETSLHFMTWIPLELRDNGESAPMTLEFIDTLCQYSVLGSSMDQIQAHHSTLALSILNEILYRRFIPIQFEKHIRRIVHLGIELLNFILGRSSNKDLPQEYMNKVVDFLSLITSTHFNQFHSESSKAFLSLLLPFTFRENEPKNYYTYLTIWTKLLDYLSAHLPIFYDNEGSPAAGPSNNSPTLETFKQPILALANGIVQSTVKYQVDEGSPGDEDFDDEEDEDSQLPKLERNIDILIKIGLLFPTDSLESLMETWNHSCHFFTSLTFTHNTHELLISNPIDIQHFNFIVNLMGRMATFTTGDSEVFKSKIDYGKSVIKQFITIGKVSKSFYTLKKPEAIIDANCNILIALRSWVYFLEKYHSEIVLCESSLDDQMYFFEILESIVEIIFYGLDKYSEVSPVLIETSVNLFNTLINLIRTQFIYQMSSVQALISNVHLLRDMNINREVFRNLNKSVSILLLLPWQSVSEQEWETRTKQYNAFMKNLLDHFLTSEPNPSSIEFYLDLLTDQLDVIMIESGHPKRTCWNVLKDIVPYLQKLSVAYLRQPSVEEKILTFYTKIMEVLRQQAGIPFFEESIQGFLYLFSTENLINDLLQETESSSLVIAKFLGMLQFMIKDPSPSFKKFIPSTLEICYDHIYPILAQRSSPDLKIPFFTLVREIVHYRWNWFFSPTMILQPQNSSSSSTVELSILSQQRLIQILQSIGHSFIQSDLDVFRYNLNTLSFWNEKHNFYIRCLSLENGKILTQFLTVLLQVLVHKTHDLHREEVARVLHEMSIAINLNYFIHQFLTDFLNEHFPTLNQDQRNELRSVFVSQQKSQQQPSTSLNISGSTRKPDENLFSQVEIDLPSFTSYLNVFIDDLRHYCFVMESRKDQNQSKK